MKRQRLDARLQPKLAQCCAEPVEGTQRAGAVARRKPLPHQHQSGRLIGGILGCQLLPPAAGPQRLEIATMKLAPWLLGPRRIRIGGKQFSPIERGIG